MINYVETVTRELDAPEFNFIIFDFTSMVFVAHGSDRSLIRSQLKVYAKLLMSPLSDGFNDSVCLHFHRQIMFSISRQCPLKEGDSSVILSKDSNDCNV